MQKNGVIILNHIKYGWKCTYTKSLKICYGRHFESDILKIAKPIPSMNFEWFGDNRQPPYGQLVKLQICGIFSSLIIKQPTKVHHIHKNQIQSLPGNDPFLSEGELPGWPLTETDAEVAPDTTEENEGALPPGTMEGEARLSGEGVVRVRGHRSSGGSNPSGPNSHSGMKRRFG